MSETHTTHETEEVLKSLQERIKRSNPSFTEQSLRTTVEVIMVAKRDMCFIDRIDPSEIEAIVESIPAEWNIKIRKPVKG